MKIIMAGLPSSPPPYSGGSSGFGPGEPGTTGLPLTVDVSPDKNKTMDARIISVISLSSFLLIFLFAVVVVLVLRDLKSGESANALGPATSSMANRSGKLDN